MKRTHRRLLFVAWPLACGLVVGGLLGTLTHSWAIAGLAGGLAWLCFIGLMYSAGRDDDGYEPNRLVSPGEIPDPSDLEQQIMLRSYGAVGMGTYAELYRNPEYRNSDGD